MTHNVDCTVVESARDEVQRVAELFHEGEDREATELAEWMGWELIGGGAGRTVFRVSDPGGEGETAEHPCVIKFASGHGRYSGVSQNIDELYQWDSLPDEVRDVDPPVFVPIRDRDRLSSDPLWLSMPEVEHGGSPEGVLARLAQVGMRCEDMHYDNVGLMHGEPVVLDYGLDCYGSDTPTELAQELVDEFEHEGCRNITVDVDEFGHVIMEFHPPEWTVPSEGSIPPKSGLVYEPGVGMSHARFKFGTWPRSKRDGVEEAMEFMDDEVSDAWGWSVLVEPSIENDNGHVYMSFEVSDQSGEGMPPDIAAELYDEFLAVLDEFAVGAFDPKKDAEALKSWLHSIKAQDVVVHDHGASAQVYFQPPLDSPGFKPEPVLDGIITVTGRGVTSLVAVFGPWRKGEPRRPTLAEAAGDLTDKVQDRHPDVELTWKLSDLSGVEEVVFEASPTSEGADLESVSVESIQEVYMDLYDGVKGTFPRPRLEGEPKQVRLDEIADAINETVSEEIERSASTDSEREALRAELRERMGVEESTRRESMRQRVRDRIDV